MKLGSKLALLNLLCCTTLPVMADDASTAWMQQQQSMSHLVKYFQNFGSYLGFDVTQLPSASDSTQAQTKLLNLPVTQLAQTYLFYSFLGALPVNTFNSNAFAEFAPKGSANNVDSLNNLANTTFSQQNYNSPSSSNSGSSAANNVTVNALIDQQTYQNDPVSQGILNILGTPNYTFCMYNDGVTPNGKCDNIPYNTLVPYNVIGTPLPSPQRLFSYCYMQQFMSQLNTNTLLSPLMYNTQSAQTSVPPCPPDSNQPNNTTNNNPGLTAQSQVQQAANFIRYVSGGVTPAGLLSWSDYTSLYRSATTPGTDAASKGQQQSSQAALSSYLTSLRTYAAQSSVGLSNLYYIMSKRLPQTIPKTDSSSGESLPPTSQELSEFNMATWRLFNPQSTTPGSTQWMNQINTASSVSVQKEIAILLAEINYQMYLDRQIQERILLTNSVMLLQNTRNFQPKTSINTKP
ncbi:MAG: type IVB secretion system protein IcmX [Legionella sp.]